MFIAGPGEEPPLLEKQLTLPLLRSFHPRSPKARDLHLTGEGLSVGTPNRWRPHRGFEKVNGTRAARAWNECRRCRTDATGSILMGCLESRIEMLDCGK
jgi:hypothetical protein